MQDESKVNGDKTEGMGRFRPLLATAVRRVNKWWVLSSLVPVVLVLLADATGMDWFNGKSLHENIAVPILVVAVIAWLLRTRQEYSTYFALITFQVFVFMLREIHFEGAGTIVNVGSAITVVLVLRLAWRTDWNVQLPKIDWRQVSALTATVATYAVAILIQRRVFRGVPGEARLHVALEEVSENFAHLWFLASCFIGWKRTKAGESE